MTPSRIEQRLGDMVEEFRFREKLVDYSMSFEFSDRSLEATYGLTVINEAMRRGVLFFIGNYYRADMLMFRLYRLGNIEWRCGWTADGTWSPGWQAVGP